MHLHLYYNAPKIHHSTLKFEFIIVDAELTIKINYSVFIINGADIIHYCITVASNLQESVQEIMKNRRICIEIIEIVMMIINYTLNRDLILLIF